MNTLKHICSTMMQRLQRAFLHPASPENASHEHRRRWQVVRNEHESDRLDRLRNPAKYQGR